MVLNPRVNIQVQNAITLTQPGGAGTIALLGTAQWGSTTELLTFGSFIELLDYYKEDTAALSQGIVRAADIAYQNGANIVKVLRIADGAEVSASVAIDGAGPTVGVLTFSAIFPGTYGNNILVTITTQGTGRTASITDGQVTENYTNNSNANGYATNAALAAAINAASQLVSVAVLSGSETTNLVNAASNQALTGGADGASAIDAADYTTAFDSFLANEEWDILLAPGTDALNALDSFHTTMTGKLNTRATSDKKFGIFISGVTLNENLAGIQARATAGERLVLCAPSIQYVNRYDSTTLNLNGTFLACALAGNIAAADVETSPTRKVLSVSPIVNTTTGKLYYSLAEIEQVLQQRVVPVSRIENGIKVARGVTRIADTSSIYFEINIVRIVDFIRAQVQEALDPFLGQSNLVRTRTQMAAVVDGLLEADRNDEIIAAFGGTQVTEGLSPDSVNVTLQIQPTFAVNFINVTLAVSRL